MVYLDSLSRVPDQNGISRLYIEGSRPEWYISTIYQGFQTRMVYLDYISRVPDQNGISRLSIEGSRPEWYISTIYRGFQTRMVYLDSLSRVPDQNGISRLSVEGSRPEWYILTIYRGFQTRMVYLDYISRVPDQNGISQACCIVEMYHSSPEPSIPYVLEILHSGQDPSLCTSARKRMAMACVRCICQLTPVKWLLLIYLSSFDHSCSSGQQSVSLQLPRWPSG